MTCGMSNERDVIGSYCRYMAHQLQFGLLVLYSTRVLGNTLPVEDLDCAE